MIATGTRAAEGQRQVSEQHPPVRLRVLGSLEAYDGTGARLDLGGPRQRAVLALLLAARGAVVVGRPDHRRPVARRAAAARDAASLQAYVSHLRQRARAGPAARTPATVLVSAPPGYALRLPDEAVDAWRFEALVRDGARPALPTTRRAPAAALDRGAGAVARRRLRRVRRRGVGRAGGRPGSTSCTPRAVEPARRRRSRSARPAEAVPDLEPLRGEPPAARGAPGGCSPSRSTRAAGRPTPSPRCAGPARRLADELGVDPARRWPRLEADILAQRRAPGHRGTARRTRRLPPTGRQPRTAAPGGTAGAPRTDRAVRRAGRASWPRSPRRPPGAPRPAPAAGAALVAGEPGAGKSSAARGRRPRARWPGLAGRLGPLPGGRGRAGRLAVEPSCCAVWPAAPAVGGRRGRAGPAARRHTQPARRAGRRGRRGSGCTARSAPGSAWPRRARRPLLVVLDDLHRADAETLDLLADVAAELPSAPLLVLVAPTAAAEVDDPAGRGAGRSGPRGPVRLAPRRSGRRRGRRAGHGAVRRRRSTARSPRRSWPRTDGNPFYVRETARLLASEGALVARGRGAGRASATSSAAGWPGCPRSAQTVLRLAAVLGRDVEVDVLLAADDADEEPVARRAWRPA